MVADAQRASLRERESVAHAPGEVAAIAKRIHDARKPSVERRQPIVNNDFDALDDLILDLERVRAVVAAADAMLYNDIRHADIATDCSKSAAYRVSLQLDAACDLLQRAEELAGGIQDAIGRGQAA